jgi:hypothetical protein
MRWMSSNIIRWDTHNRWCDCIYMVNFTFRLGDVGGDGLGSSIPAATTTEVVNAAPITLSMCLRRFG